MPKQPRYTDRVIVDITPAMRRQLVRLSAHHEKSIPEVVRSGLAAAYGPPTDQDRQPQLLDAAPKAKTTAPGGNKRGKAKKG